MLKIAICDDEIMIASQIENMLEKISNTIVRKVEIDVFYDGSTLVNHIKEGMRYDLIYLDIEMKKQNGVDAARELRIIAICLDMFRECTVLLLLFFSLRSFVGGLHMSSFNACFVCSCTVVSLILIMVKYCSLPKVISVFISACGIAIIFFLKPVENKNRPTEEKERKLFSHRTRLILLLTVLSVVLFYFGGFHSHLMTVTYTLVAIIISMFLGRIKNAFEIS